VRRTKTKQLVAFEPHGSKLRDLVRPIKEQPHRCELAFEDADLGSPLENSF